MTAWPPAAAILGSVGSRVIERAGRPLFVVGPAAPAITPGNDVAVALDGRHDPEPLLAAAVGWATLFDAPLRLVTVYEPVPSDIRDPQHFTRSRGPSTDPDLYLQQVRARLEENAPRGVELASVPDPVSVAAGLSHHLADGRPWSLSPAGNTTGTCRAGRHPGAASHSRRARAARAGPARARNRGARRRRSRPRRDRGVSDQQPPDRTRRRAGSVLPGSIPASSTTRRLSGTRSARRRHPTSARRQDHRLRGLDAVRLRPRCRLRACGCSCSRTTRGRRLTLIVSLEAIFLSTFVLIGQNRQAAFQQAKADHDYEHVNQMLEENTALTRTIHELTRDGPRPIARRFNDERVEPRRTRRVAASVSSGADLARGMISQRSTVVPRYASTIVMRASRIVAAVLGHLLRWETPGRSFEHRVRYRRGDLWLNPSTPVVAGSSSAPSARPETWPDRRPAGLPSAGVSLESSLCVRHYGSERMYRTPIVTQGQGLPRLGPPPWAGGTATHPAERRIPAGWPRPSNPAHAGRAVAAPAPATAAVWQPRSLASLGSDALPIARGDIW